MVGEESARSIHLYQTVYAKPASRVPDARESVVVGTGGVKGNFRGFNTHGHLRYQLQLLRFFCRKKDESGYYLAVVDITA